MPITPAALVSHQAIIYDQRGGGTTWDFQAGEAIESIVVRGRLRVTAAEGIREAIFANLGYAIASRWMFAPELARGEVVSVLDQWRLPAVSLWALFPTGRQPNAKVRSFVDFVAARLGSAV